METQRSKACLLDWALFQFRDACFASLPANQLIRLARIALQRGATKPQLEAIAQDANERHGKEIARTAERLNQSAA